MSALFACTCFYLNLQPFSLRLANLLPKEFRHLCRQPKRTNKKGNDLEPLHDTLTIEQVLKIRKSCIAKAYVIVYLLTPLFLIQFVRPLAICPDMFKTPLLRLPQPILRGSYSRVDSNNLADTALDTQNILESRRKSRSPATQRESGRCSQHPNMKSGQILSE